ncbi:MAG: cytochrome c assembly protein, partial [Saprospiraceae bacterium]
MKHWWKILTVMILLYVLTIGMLAPLAPGITSVSPEKAMTGKILTMQVNGYNSNFTKSKEIIRAWLELDTMNALCAESIKIIDDTQLELTFSIPSSLPSQKMIES